MGYIGNSVLYLQFICKYITILIKGKERVMLHLDTVTEVGGPGKERAVWLVTTSVAFPGLP